MNSIDCSTIIPVLLPYPFQTPFYYTVPSDLQIIPLGPGNLIKVPLNGRKEIGVVWHDSTLPKTLSIPQDNIKKIKKFKPILSILPLPPLPLSLLQFVDWVAAYTLSPRGSVLAITLRGIQKIVNEKANPKKGWVISNSKHDLNGIPRTKAREKTLAYLKRQQDPKTTLQIVKEAQVSPSVIKNLHQQGILEEKYLAEKSIFQKPNIHFNHITLNAEQQVSTQFLNQKIQENQFSATLLQGITGSGKTEVYMEAIADCINIGKVSLILLPEIALSSQWINRFEKRFGVKPALWHSDLTEKQRRLTWQAALRNEISVLVGARSALFLPLNNLGLIIVDEEHESSFKQEEGIIYHARDMAIVKATLSKCPIVLVSATPSLETLVNAKQKKYHHLTLTQRHGEARLPNIEIVNMRHDPPNRGLYLSPRLVKATKKILGKKEQILFFLNRRGYAPLTLCRACGFRMECPHCSAWLIEHRAQNKLICHHCDYSIPFPKECPHCLEKESLVPIGPGIERITEEARTTFPDAKILIMSSDTLTSPIATAEAIKLITQHEVDLIIGTQIVAKGWHFPYLTLVGVIDADLGLSGADLRASEKTLQLLHQVSGRAGREQIVGTVMLQSYLADHPVIKALAKNDFDEFMRYEANERKEGFWPPYGRLTAIIISADDEETTKHTAYELSLHSPKIDSVLVLGPTAAPLALLRNRYRQRFLIRSKKNLAIQPVIRQWLSCIKIKKGVKIEVDVDPISFL
ncbi:Primosomal protein N' [Commensalibacter sp. Nvir]|uniref:primosomal protein N' n=1 Tax=Commensalibacter sp. Nvir TaxID=3069817 RepID=UPI002D2D068F|nr:Primosomal protein N' [Commensalibacter sp. Nvir]